MNAAAETTAPQAEVKALRGKVFRGKNAPKPGSEFFGAVLRAFTPAVYGIASKLLGQSDAAEALAAAVLKTFALRFRQIPRKTLLGEWFLRTTLIGGRRERRRMGLPKKEKTPTAVLCESLQRLPRKLREPVLLTQLFRMDPASAGAALRIRPQRLEKRLHSAIRRLSRKARLEGGQVKTLLQDLGEALDPEMLERITATTQAVGAPAPLVQNLISSWRWIRFRGAVRRAFVTSSAVLCVLALTAGTLGFLASRGYFTMFFMRMGQRQELKDFPEMFVPAKSWPASEQDRAMVPKSFPHTSAELLRTTNIWPVKLSFTAAQWKGLKPSHVEPVRNIFRNGQIILRNPKAKRSGLSGVIGFDFNWTEAQLEFAGEPRGPIGVRYRGNGTFLNSLSGSKQSLKLDFGKFKKGNELAGLDELNLLNCIVDYSFMHDALAEKLFRDLGAVGPRTAYAYVIVNVDGKEEPHGLFAVVENIDGDFAKDRFGDKHAPIFKPVTYDLFKDLGDDWTAYQEIYDLKTKATPEQQQRVIEFAKLVSHATDEEFARRLPEFLDLEEFAGFLAGHVLLSSYDGFLTNGQNYYIYLDPRSNRFGFIPWDQDHSWGDFGHVSTAEKREHASIWAPAVYDFQFLKRVLKTDAFREVYRRKLETALDSTFKKETLYAEIDQLAAILRPAVAAESDFRLERFSKAVSSEWVPGPRDGTPEGPRAPIHQIKRFIENRIQSVRDQLDGKSDGERLAGFGR